MNKWLKLFRLLLLFVIIGATLWALNVTYYQITVGIGKSTEAKLLNLVGEQFLGSASPVPPQFINENKSCGFRLVLIEQQMVGPSEPGRAHALRPTAPRARPPTSSPRLEATLGRGTTT